jgi:hypothetical protein
MFFNKVKKILKQTEEKLIASQTEVEKFKAQNNELVAKYASYIEKDKVIEQLKIETEKAKKDLFALNENYKVNFETFCKLEAEINLYTDSLEIGTFGLYQPQFDYQNSENFKNAIENNYEKQKQLIKDDSAAICTIEWTVEGSKSEGRKMTNQYKKLMLFAFNGECDSCIAKVKWNNAGKSKIRIEKAFESINKLGITQKVYLANELLQLKFEELALWHEYDLKLHAEKEQQRRIREQMREEEKAQRDYERAQNEAEEEEGRFQKALDKAKRELNSVDEKNLKNLKEQILSLEQKLKDAQEKKQRAISLAQQTKVGHIYIISNIGSFGDEVYKIGLTRRLDPLDRIRELGDASVPFHFDVHAVIYSEDAPQLEYEIHQKFNDKRLNRINGRREFFKVTLSEVEDFVKQHTNAEIEFIKLAEAKEYRQTLTLLKQINSAISIQKLETKFPKDLL